MIALSLLLEGREGFAYADLRRYYQFDLGAWLNGEDYTTLDAVIAMLSGLPKQSAWAAHYTAERNRDRLEDEDRDIPETLTPEQEFEKEFLERQEWGDSDLHLAEIGNTLNSVLAVLVNNKKFKPDPIGPDFMLPKEDAQSRRQRRIEAMKKRASENGQRAYTLEGLYRMLGAVVPPDAD